MRMTLPSSASLQDGFGGLLHHRLRRRMHAKNFHQHVFQCGDAVFRQKFRQMRRQVVVRQHLVHEFAVKHRPRRAGCSANAAAG